MSTESYDLLANAACDLDQVDSAYDAELLVSALLGSVYAVAKSDRAAAVSEFVRGFRRYLNDRAERDRTDRAAPLLRAVLDALTPGASPSGASPSDTAPSDGEPAWAAHLGTATATATFSYGDAYSDQINYLAVFTYPDPVLGGPDHVLSVLVDHSFATVRTLFIATPASALLDQLRSSAAEDDTMHLDDIEPAVLHAAVTPYLAAIDIARHLPDDASFGTDLAVARARLSLLAPLDNAAADDAAGATGADATGADAQISRFRASAEANRLVGGPGNAASLEFCLDTIQRYAAGLPDRDALRWSPTAVRLFLLDWAPRHAVLDATDRALLPRVLDAWVRWAGRSRHLPPRLVAATIMAIAEARPTFTTLARSGVLRSPQAQAVATMLTEGIDPNDEVAVTRWLAEHQN